MSELTKYLEPYGDLVVRVPEQDDFLSTARVTEMAASSDPSLRITVISGDRASIPTALEQALAVNFDASYLGDNDVADLAMAVEADAERVRIQSQPNARTSCIIDDSGEVVVRADTFCEEDGRTMTVVVQRVPVEGLGIPMPEDSATVLDLAGPSGDAEDEDG